MSSGQDQFIIHDDGHADTHGEHHGHVIVSKGTLVAIFGALLFFTLLTVGLAQVEQLIAHTFEIVIPQWVNVLVAMSIASVKTMLVVLYFMQLRYDNPTNSMVFIFTILTVGFFLGFTVIDLGNRGSIYGFKAQYIVPGGTGLSSDRKPVTATAAAAASNPEHPLHQVWLHAQHKDDHAAHLRRGAGDGTLIFDDAPMNRSGAERSRPVRGLTLPGFAPAQADPHGAPAGDAHGAAPADKPADHAKPAPAGH
jgi:cytochrome c oxidase subunit 4